MHVSYVRLLGIVLPCLLGTLQHDFNHLGILLYCFAVFEVRLDFSFWSRGYAGVAFDKVKKRNRVRYCFNIITL